MNTARILGAGLVGTLVYFVYGFLVEGLLIADHFRPYTAVYRTAEQLKRVIPIGLLTTLLAIVVMAVIYAKGYEGGSGLAEGARFGLLVAVFAVCTVVAHTYVTINIGGRLAAELAVSTLVQWTLVGIAIGLVYKPALVPPR